MTTSPDQDHLDGDGQGRFPTLEAIEQALERLGELTGPHVIDAKEDLSAAAARIPDDDRRREAEELLHRLRPVIEPHLDAIEEASPDVDGLASPDIGQLASSDVDWLASPDVDGLASPDIGQLASSDVDGLASPDIGGLAPA